MDIIQERLFTCAANCVGWLIAVCLLLSAGAIAHAQSTSTGDIRGTVTDSTGAVVPGASCPVLNVNTGEQKDLHDQQRRPV